MRIACIHVPQFALQCLGRVDPALRGAAVAVVGAGSEPPPGGRSSAALHSPVVLACSRAAHALGVRIGMTASAARFVSSDIRVVPADAQLERETVRAIADALLGVSAVVDLGGRIAGGASSGAHLAMYCEVPGKTRGTSFGDRLLALLDDFGITGRIGIADDRFTAWVAAAHSGSEGTSARQGAGSKGASAPRSSSHGEREIAGARREVGVSSEVTYSVREHVARPAGRRASGASQAQGAVREPASRSAGGPGPGPGGREGAGVSAEASEALRQLAPRAGKPDGKRDDRAERNDRGVVSVPRGGSAAFLSPRPLSLLAITPEVQHMLEALGVRTLGEFAALPAPSVARPVEADYQALARGDSGRALRPYAPDAAICEALAVGSSANTLFSSAAAVTQLAERLALRLAGRARLATRFEITVMRNGADRVIPVTADRPVGLASELVEVIAAAVGEGPIAKLRVVVAGEAIAGGDAGGAEVDITEPLVDALSAALSSNGTAMPLIAPLGHLAPLALPGASQPWQLSASELRSERRDAHRRTRRAKSRRGPAIQPPLFNKGEG
jgi:nucleotidyltransferase/DNA polymerase involved in DNA repair